MLWTRAVFEASEMAISSRYKNMVLKESNFKLIKNTLRTAQSV